MKKWSKLGVSALTAFGLAATSSVAMADSNSNSDSTSAGQTWTVEAGNLTPNPNGDIVAMAFFPHVIVIDAGDTVNFVGFGHTVDFPGSDGKAPQIGTDTAMAPAGGKSFDGSTYTASGMLMGKPWSLTFTNAGVYPYYCGMHPGMTGVVVVQDAGTPYPMTPAQYATASAAAKKLDLNAATAALKAFPVQKTPGKNGTSVYHIHTDIPMPLSYTFKLGENGSATISMAKPGLWNIKGTVTGLTGGQSYTPALNWGQSDSGVAVQGAKFSPVTASDNGTATFSGTLSAFAVSQGTWVLDVDDENGSSAASGVINYPSYADETFVPSVLKVHAGDTVVWTQIGGNEAHTVTFGKPPKNANPTQPVGGHSYAGSGFFSSGFLLPGQSYQLTFTKAGSYHYICLLHSMMNMHGTIVVQPAAKAKK